MELVVISRRRNYFLESIGNPFRVAANRALVSPEQSLSNACTHTQTDRQVQSGNTCESVYTSEGCRTCVQERVCIADRRKRATSR